MYISSLGRREPELRLASFERGIRVGTALAAQPVGSAGPQCLDAVPLRSSGCPVADSASCEYFWYLRRYFDIAAKIF
jgi:hypothetical protein